MKRQPLIIERLFQAAKQAPARAVQPMRAPMQMRILAQWRAGRLSSKSSALELLLGMRAVFRFGLGAALAVTLACLAWSYHDLNPQPDTDLDAAALRANLDLEL